MMMRDRPNSPVGMLRAREPCRPAPNARQRPLKPQIHAPLALTLSASTNRIRITAINRLGDGPQRFSLISHELLI